MEVGGFATRERSGADTVQKTRLRSSLFRGGGVEGVEGVEGIEVVEVVEVVKVVKIAVGMKYNRGGSLLNIIGAKDVAIYVQPIFGIIFIICERYPRY